MTFSITPFGLRIRTLWLRLRIDAYSRQLHSIWAQRENDFEAERMLYRQLCAARTKLRKLTKERQESDPDQISLPPNKFRPSPGQGPAAG